VIFLSHLNQYISSSYYNFHDAPTWNYMSVQVTGAIKILEKEELWESVRSLTDKYEKGMKNPVSLDALPADVLRQMEGIVGFEIVISEMESIFTMSQNRDEVNFRNIIKALKASGDPKAVLTAEMMEKLPKLLIAITS
jgi:transcriptional regulator